MSPLPSYHADAAQRADPLAHWKNKAACRGLGKLFDSIGRKDQWAARDICAACPVQLACRQWVLRLTEDDDPGGICAGMTAAERTRARTATEPAKRPNPVIGVAKVCRICKRLKQPSDFYRNGESPDGLRNECVPCYRGQKKQGAA